MYYHRIPVPKVLAMVITSMQLLQMVFGCGVNILAWNYKASGSNIGSQSLAFELTNFLRPGMRCQPQQPLLVLPDVHQLLHPVCQV